MNALVALEQNYQQQKNKQKKASNLNKYNLQGTL